MLIRFRASNFRSLRDEVELSMVASSFEDDSGPLVPCEALGCSLLRVAAIYGANAAGKSNVLAAMWFMGDAVWGSHRILRPDERMPIQPFLLDPKTSLEPAQFEADFLLDGIRYRYGFRLDSVRIHGEWLYAYPNRRPQLWFSRADGPQPAFTFGKHLKGNHRAIASLVRNNSLFLSAAAENNHPALSPIHQWLARLRQGQVHSPGPLSLYLQSQSWGEGLDERLLAFLTQADLGIAGWNITQNGAHGLQGSNPKIELLHRVGRDGEGIKLPLHFESQGTQTWLALSATVLTALDSGTVLSIDEFDASLHPHLALEVVRIFEDPERNPKNAQLIFNTHDTNLLSSLRRDQIWFVEKDEGGATHLYPLTDFKPRKGENLERGYLQGRYGAIPFLGDLSLTADGSPED